MAVPVTLQVFKGDELIATKEYDRDYIKIGRLSSAHLCLDDEKVSRIHSVIEVGQDGTLSVIDMGSVEGTYVNGKRVTKVAINFGDEIKVGNTTIRIAQAAANLQAAAADGAPEPATAVEQAPAALGQAAAQPEPEPEAPAPEPPAPEAMDSSFAATQRNPVSAPVDEMPAAPEEMQHRPRPARRKGGGPLGLELRMMWGDQIVGEYFIRRQKRSFAVGSAKGVDFIMGDAKLGTPRFVLVRAESDGFQLRFNNRMKGEITRGNETLDLRGAIESGRAQQDGDDYAVPLGVDDFAWVDLGGVTVEACFQPVPKPVFVPWADSIDFTAVNIFLVLFFLAALFVISAANRAVEGDELSDELSGTEARIAKLIIKPPDAQKNPLLEKLAQQKEKRESGEIAAKHKGDEGQMGKKDAPKRSAHAAPKGDPSQKDQARMLAQRVFGGRGGGLSTVFGSGGLGGELRSAMGNMFGAAPGDARGFGGMGLRGTGGGGGGVADTIGIGAIGTKGRGGGTGGYGNGVGVIGGKSSVDIGITQSDPVVMGSLDKELIRQVIAAHRNQIRYCYENELTRTPKLGGKVAVKFVISAAGTVVQSSVVQSTANNDNLESCVAGRVRTWIFPKPKGGGLVVVTYPFIFKQAGE